MSATEYQLLCRWHECPSGGPFSDAQTLFDHLVNTHSPSAATALYCDWDGCSRRSPLQGEIDRCRHFRAHAGHKPFRCSREACGASFCTEWQLKDHARRHRRTVRPSKLQCRWAGCRRAFTEDVAGAALLAAHLAAEHCASPCRWADCTRRPRSSFKDHVIGHLPAWYKPFKCSICGKTFQRLNIFTRHTNGAAQPNGCLTKLRGGAGSGSLQGGMPAAADRREVEMLPPSPLSLLSSPPTSPASSPPPQLSSSPLSFFPSPPPPPTLSSPAPFQAEEEPDVFANDRALDTDSDISNAALHARLLSAENLICEMQAEIDTLRQAVHRRAGTPDDDFDWSLDE